MAGYIGKSKSVAILDGLTPANNLSDVNSAATSRTNLGLGSIATQASTSVSLTGGTIDGITIGGTTPGAVTATSLTVDNIVIDGDVINYGAGDVTQTFSANSLAFAGASSGYTFDAQVFSTFSGADIFRADSSSATYSRNLRVRNSAFGNVVIGASSNVGHIATDMTTLQFHTASDLGVDGTSTPSNPRAYLNATGLGIGTTPSYPLHIVSSNTTTDIAYFQGDSLTTGKGLQLYSNSASFSNVYGLLGVNVDNASATGTGLSVYNDGTGNAVFIDNNGSGNALYTDGGDVVVMNGDVGIGIASPSAKLHVSGGRTYVTGNNEAFNLYLQYNSGTSGMFIGGSSAGELQVSTVGGSGVVWMTPNGEIRASTATNQFGAKFVTRVAGNNYEWGHPNTAGYGSTLGAESGSGTPFIGFECGAGTTSNTYKTLGLPGSVIKSDNSGNLYVYRVTNSNADNQSLTGPTVTFTSGGNVNVPGGSVSDEYGNVRSVPTLGATSTAYTLQASDAGRYVQVNSGGSITIPNNTFSTGDVVTIITGANTATITCSISFAFLTGDTTNQSSVTLAERGICTLLFTAGTIVYMSGNIS